MLLIDPTQKVIDTAEIGKGTLIYAKHRSWDKGQTGIVTTVSEKQIRVMFLPDIQNVLNHFHITAADLEAGVWEVRYSNDGLQSIVRFGGEDNGS